MTQFEQGKLPDEIQALRTEVQILLEFAVSQAVVSIPDTVIDEALAALEQPGAKEKTAALWKVRNKLSAVIKPATAESLRAINALTKDQEKRPTFWRFWWKDPLVRAQSFYSITWVIATVIILVIAQFYALSVSNILASIDRAEKEWTERLGELKQIELQIAADTSNNQTLRGNRDVIDAEVRFQESSIESGYALLHQWGAVFSWSVPKSPDGKTDQIGLRNVSIAFLKGFGLYLLPLLYGLFGANVYILRQLIVKLDSWSLNSISVTKHHLRRVLGAILGATVGLLFEDGDVIASIGFGLATMAFLAGYSSELVFSILDSLITKIKQSFAPAKSYESDAPLPPKQAPAGPE